MGEPQGVKGLYLKTLFYHAVRRSREGLNVAASLPWPLRESRANAGHGPLPAQAVLGSCSDIGLAGGSILNSAGGFILNPARANQNLLFGRSF